MAKTMKVMELQDNGFHIKVVRDFTDKNFPYHIYKVWYGHQRLLAKTTNMARVSHFIYYSYLYGLDTYPVDSYVIWAKDWERKEI